MEYVFHFIRLQKGLKIYHIQLFIFDGCYLSWIFLLIFQAMVLSGSG
jgi:hypothetical protein